MLELETEVMSGYVSSAYLHRELSGITVFTSDAWTTYDAKPIAKPCMTVVNICHIHGLNIVVLCNRSFYCNFVLNVLTCVCQAIYFYGVLTAINSSEQLWSCVIPVITIPCFPCVGVEGVINCDINKERVDRCDTVSEEGGRKR